MSLLLFFIGCKTPKKKGLGKVGAPSNIFTEKKGHEITRKRIQKDDDEIIFILAHIIPGILK